MGPTASGKTSLAEALADKFDACLINGDAFQVYRGMDIGTAKPVNKDRYHLIDIKDPSEDFGVGEYVALAQSVLAEMWESQRNVIVVGGSGLYVRALFEEYSGMSAAPDPNLRTELNQRSLESLLSELERSDSDAFARIDHRNRVRVQRAVERLHCPRPSVTVELPPYSKLKLAVIPDTFETSDRITRRVHEMMQNGWIDEVQRLIEAGFSPNDPGMRALGYKPIWQYLNGEMELSEVEATTIADTRKYAKRQRTWLRSEPNLVVLDANDALLGASKFVMQCFKEVMIKNGKSD